MSPSKPLRACPVPGCPELTRGGRCRDHATELELRRPSATGRGYGNEWRRIRARYLRDYARRNAAGAPICENCGRSADDVGAPLEVDHIDGSGPTGNNDPSNLQALCKPCHSTKTAAQTRGGS